jgi:hypothetical protein
MEKLKADVEKCRNRAEVEKVIKKYGFTIQRDDSQEVGCFSVWLGDTIRIYKPSHGKKMIFQRWAKTSFKYSGIPVFFGSL